MAISASETDVSALETMVSVTQTVVSDSEPSVSDAKTAVSDPKPVFRSRNDRFGAKTIVSDAEKEVLDAEWVRKRRGTKISVNAALRLKCSPAIGEVGVMVLLEAARMHSQITDVLFDGVGAIDPGVLETRRPSTGFVN